uniref:Uncharacterized protein n=1 Tax=Rhizophora mucronata TaxID=61149 RepID=A0A2P2Q7F1_RHIMU
MVLLTIEWMHPTITTGAKSLIHRS